MVRPETTMVRNSRSMRQLREREGVGVLPIPSLSHFFSPPPKCPTRKRTLMELEVCIRPSLARFDGCASSAKEKGWAFSPSLLFRISSPRPSVFAFFSPPPKGPTRKRTFMEQEVSISPSLATLDSGASPPKMMGRAFYPTHHFRNLLVFPLPLPVPRCSGQGQGVGIGASISRALQHPVHAQAPDG
jgi:hypothetical protein